MHGAYLRNSWFLRHVHIHDSRLRSYLRRRRLSPHEIQDFCQEVYLRILDNSVQPESSQAFLLRTARNLFIDAVRHRKYVRMHTVSTPEATHELTPDREVQSEQDVIRFLSCVQSLSPQKRKIYWLRVVEDQPVRQISKQLAISNRTVEAHLTAARKYMARTCQ